MPLFANGWLASLTVQRQLVQQQASLQAGMFLVGTVYNFCTDHHSLRIRLWMTERQYRWVQRTPAMAAHLTVDTQAYPAAIHFLEGAFGFTVIERPISMGANLTDFPIPSEILELELKRQQEDDLWIKPVTSADLPDLMPFVAAYFGWDWYRHLQEYLLEYFGDSSSQICVLVARLRGEVVGFCPQRHERFGPFGVRPDARNLGIGRILLFRCLAEMSARHIYYSYFMWTGDYAARLYTQAGYKQRRTFAILRKEL